MLSGTLMASLPDPSASRAVLIGAGFFETLDGLPAVVHSAETLGSLFTEQDIWGLPPEHCRVVLNPQTPRQLSKPVAEAAQEATDTLVVYYAGHGLIEPRTGELHLAVADSDWTSVHDTAAPYEWIRRSIEHSPADRKIVVIDCCYSARAFGVQSPDDGAFLEVQGTYLLAASAENAVAIAPPGDQYTAFTGELIRLISNGVLDGDEYLVACRCLVPVCRVGRLVSGSFPFPLPDRTALMPSQKKRPVTLTAADRDELVRVTTTGVHPASMIRRARVLLALDTSVGVVDPKEVIAARLEVSGETIRLVA
ncbi:caspase family protein, partial [Streptomyces sp. NPDC048484]|uniref:caspase family protein n=1 Tax=Streptomyces sp. NPDC048484 TaxID=3155146 RepID=UPI00342585E6